MSNLDLFVIVVLKVAPYKIIELSLEVYSG